MPTAVCESCGASRDVAPYMAGLRIRCKACPEGWMTASKPADAASPPAPPPPPRPVSPPPPPVSALPPPPTATRVASSVYRAPAEPPRPPAPTPQVAARAVKPTEGRPADPFESPQPPPSGYFVYRVPRLRRLAARWLDMLAATLVFFLGWVLAVLVLQARSFTTAELARDASVAVVLLLLLGPLAVLSILNIVWLSTRGQSIGKRLLGIRIVWAENGEPAGFLRAFLMRDFLTGLIGIIPVVDVVYAWANVLCIFGESRKCLHDHIAGTRVEYVPGYFE